LLSEVLSEFIPNKVLQSSTMVNDWPLMQNKDFLEQSKIYLCRNYSCKQPVETLSDLQHMLRSPDNLI